MSVQALAKIYFEVENRSYAEGVVVTFANDSVGGWVVGNGWADSTPSVVAAAIAAGATQKTHTAGFPARRRRAEIYDDPDTGAPVLSPDAAVAVRRASGRPRVWGIVSDSRGPYMSADAGGLLITENGWLLQALARTGYGSTVGYLGGVSGSRVTEFGPRIETVCAMPEITDVLIKGGVNDLNAGVSGVTVAEAMIAHIERGLQSGKTVWWEEEEGGDELYSPTPTNPFSTAETAQTAIYNSIMLQRYKNHPSVRLIRFNKLIIDRSVAANTFKPGIKYDYLHDSISGAVAKAVQAIADYPSDFPTVSTSVIPSMSAYSGNPERPVQVLANPGFVTKTGGTIATGATNNGNAWTTGQAVTVGAWRFNAGNFYYAASAGTCGATAPTHTTGTQSDGAVNWTFALSFGAWTTTQVVPAWAFRYNSGALYYTTAGGTCGATGPTHTSGSVSDGGVTWTYLMSNTNSVPSSWGIKPGSANTATWKCGTATNADGTVDFIVLAMFGANGQQVDIVNGSDYDGTFTARQVATSKYSLEATVVVDQHVNLRHAILQWQRGDLTGTGPTAGVTVAGSAYSDTAANTGLTYPRTMRHKTPPYPAAAQNTSGGNVVGNVVTWNDLYVSVVSNGPGWALVRVRDARMVMEA